MPELPEVETIVRELNPHIQGKLIRGVVIHRASVVKNPPSEFIQALTGNRFLKVERKAKYLLFHLERGIMLGHLAMSGKFVIDSNFQTAGNHDRVIFTLEGGKTLVFSEIRCFGYVEWSDSIQGNPRLEKLGPDGLEPQDWKELKGRAKKTSQPIKNLLLDQHFIAGIGNIYAAEILFQARIRPTKKADKLTQKNWQALALAIPEILHLALDKNGTTISDYKRVDEKSGEFQNFLQVYQKAGQPCPRCGKGSGVGNGVNCSQPILKITQAGRSSFYCPQCQK